MKKILLLLSITILVPATTMAGSICGSRSNVTSSGTGDATVTVIYE